MTNVHPVAINRSSALFIHLLHYSGLRRRTQQGIKSIMLRIARYCLWIASGLAAIIDLASPAVSGLWERESGLEVAAPLSSLPMSRRVQRFTISSPLKVCF